MNGVHKILRLPPWCKSNVIKYLWLKYVKFSRCLCSFNLVSIRLLYEKVLLRILTVFLLFIMRTQHWILSCTECGTILSCCSMQPSKIVCKYATYHLALNWHLLKIWVSLLLTDDCNKLIFHSNLNHESSMLI